MKKYIKDFRVAESVLLSEKHLLLKLSPVDGVMPGVKPGQFVEVRVDNEPSTFLRRPISIHNVEDEQLWLLIAMIGNGTRQLGKLREGDILNLVLPLGNGFTITHHQSPLLVGGGVGIAPLLLLAKELKALGGKPVFLCGGRTAKDLVEMNVYKEIGEVYITTEDGSLGEKGFVTNHSVLAQRNFDAIYTCGPKPMMMAVAKYAKAHSIFCEASLENKMACGLGACLCCVEKTTEGHKCICSDGPVFNINEIWQD